MTTSPSFQEAAGSAGRPMAEPANVPPPPKHQGRRWVRLLAWIAAIIAIVIGVISFAPGPAARLVLHYYLDDLGIDVDGERTLDVDLWRGSMSFGPASFSFGGATPGEVERIGLDFSMTGLLKQRAIVTTLVIEGLNLHLAQAADGQITINGVPLTGLVASPEEAAEAKEKKASSWGTAIDSFDLKNSRVTFLAADERQAELHLDDLTLVGFRSWQPDEPGSFTLRGQLNGMPVSAEGEASPFADAIRVRLRYGIDGIEFPRIEQLTGPLGFDRAAGQFSIQGAGEATIEPDSATQIAATGDIKADAIDAALSKAVAFKMQSAESNYALKVGIAANGATTIAGSASIDSVQGHIDIPGGPAVAFERASLPTSDLAIAVATDGSLRLSSAPTLDVTNLSINGEPQVASRELKVQISELTVATGKGLTLETTGALSATDLVYGSAEHAQPLVSAPAADVTFTKITVNQAPHRLQIMGSSALKAPSIGISLPPSSGNTDANATTLRSPAISLTDTDFTTTGGETRLQSHLSATFDEIKVGTNTGVRESKRQSRSSAGTPAPLLATGPVSIDFAPLELTQSAEALRLKTTLTSEWQGIKSSIASAPQRPEVAASSLKLVTAPLNVVVKGPETEVSGGIQLSLNDIAARWASPLAATHGADVASQGSAGKLALEASQLAVSVSGSGVKSSGSMNINGDAIGLRSTEIDTLAGGEISLGRLRSTITEFAFDQTSQPGWRLALSASLDKLATGKPHTVPRMHAEGIEIRDLAVNDRGGVDVDAVIFNNTNAAISRQWLERMGGDPAAEQVAKKAEEVVEKAKEEKAPLRIGQLRVENNADINFEDDVLRPPARFSLKVEALDVGELNTAKPNLKTDLLLRARLNEFTPIQAQGWVSPLGQNPDFALNANIKYLQLPQLSPYSSQAIGINIESGRLSISADAAANEGNLSGVVNLAANSLVLQAVNATAENQVQQSIGLPLNSALGLLEDDDGRINLSIPLAGNLASPSFDFGDAIAQAMTNVVKGAVLAPFRLALLPVTLLSSVAGSDVPQLAPITFEPNTDTPDANGKTVLAALTKLLQEQPKLSVQVCGRATLQDRAAALAKEALPDESDPIYPVAVSDLRAGLGQLAQARTTVIRRALSDESSDIRRGRVRECRSEYNEQDNGPPRAEIKF